MNKSISTFAAALVAVAGFQACCCAENRPAADVKVIFKVGEKAVPVTLRANDAARDFASLLPLTLKLKDYAGSEKISDLPRKLNIKGAPRGDDPEIGDIAFYAPWGNLVIYYGDQPYAEGVVILGKVDSGLEKLASPETAQVTIKLATP